MLITRKVVADQLGGYLSHELSLAQLVDWAELQMMEGELAEQDRIAIRSVLARFGLADVRAFGLSWEDCEQLLGQLGFAARVNVVSA